MSLQFVENSKRSTFDGRRIPDKSLEAMAQTVFRVGVTKNLFEILIELCSYFPQFCTKSFKFCWDV